MILSIEKCKKNDFVFCRLTPFIQIAIDIRMLKARKFTKKVGKVQDYFLKLMTKRFFYYKFFLKSLDNVCISTSPQSKKSMDFVFFFLLRWPFSNKNTILLSLTNIKLKIWSQIAQIPMWICEYSYSFESKSQIYFLRQWKNSTVLGIVISPGFQSPQANSKNH
jgi:hypothetical protein